VLIFRIFRHLLQREQSFIHGKYFDSTVINFVAESDVATSEQCSVAFFAFPFLALQPPRFLDEPVTSSHPVRSLLQFQYAFESTTNHDEHQIVVDADESNDVLHVPQVWMLRINGGKSLYMAGREYSFLSNN
jgi:hypothetical protein